MKKRYVSLLIVSLFCADSFASDAGFHQFHLEAVGDDEPLRPVQPHGTPPPAYLMHEGEGPHRANPFDEIAGDDEYKLPPYEPTPADVDVAAPFQPAVDSLTQQQEKDIEQQEKRPSLWKRLFGRKSSQDQTSQQPEKQKPDVLFRQDMRTKMETVSQEIKPSEIDPFGMRLLDTNLDKKFQQWQPRMESYANKLEQLLRTDGTLSEKQRKQISQLVQKMEDLKVQMQKAVRDVQDSLVTPAGEKKLTKRAGDRAVVARVIRSGNTRALGFLEARGLKITGDDVDLALQNHQFEMADALFNFDMKARPSEEVVSRVLQVSVLNADAEAVAALIKFATPGQISDSASQVDGLLQASRKQLVTMKEEIKKPIQPVIKRRVNARGTPEIFRESDASINARRRQSTEQIALLKQRIKDLENINEILIKRLPASLRPKVVIVAPESASGAESLAPVPQDDDVIDLKLRKGG